MEDKHLIYFDLDDTLTNYKGQLIKLNLNPKDTVKEENINFWIDMEWLPKTKEVFNYSKQNFETKILTRVPNLDSPKKGKLEWVKNNIGDIEVIFTKTGKEKAKYANKNSILIDDKIENVKKFNEAGGIGILFENNPQEIINKLKKLKNELRK